VTSAPRTEHGAHLDVGGAHHAKQIERQEQDQPGYQTERGIG
jgi:hypothetical protein